MKMNRWLNINEERSEEEYESEWIRNHIKLTCPKHDNKNGACGRCGRKNPDYPCDVFGVKEADNHKSKYVRINKEKIGKTVELLLEIWKLPKPRFIISFVGGNNVKELPPAFCMGLTNLVEMLDMWFVTDGTTSCQGDMTEVVKALKGTMLTGDPFSKSSRLIGVIPWCRIGTKDPEGRTSNLDLNHTHLLFLDDESTNEAEAKETIEPKANKTKEPKANKIIEPKVNKTDELKANKTKEPKTGPKPNQENNEPNHTVNMTDAETVEQRTEPKAKKTNEPKANKTDEHKDIKTNEPKSNKTNEPKANKTNEPKPNKKNEPKPNKTNEPKANKTNDPKSNQEKNEPNHTVTMTDAEAVEQRTEPKANKTNETKANKTGEPKANKTNEPKSNKTNEPKANKTKEPKPNKKNEPKANKTNEPKARKTKETHDSQPTQEKHEPNHTVTMTDAETVEQRTEFLFKLKTALDKRLSTKIPLLLFVLKMKPDVIGAVLKAIENGSRIILIKNKKNGSGNQDKDDICGILEDVLKKEDKDKIGKLELDWLAPHVEKLFKKKDLITFLDVYQESIEGAAIKDSVLIANNICRIMKNEDLRFAKLEKRAEENKDMEQKVMEQQKDMKNKDALRITILWNTIKEAKDILKDKIPEKSYMEELMFDAIREKHINFIELFTKYDIELEEGFTVEKLKKLYHQETSAMKILKIDNFVKRLKELGYTFPCCNILGKKTDKDEVKCGCIDLFVWSLFIKNKDLAKLFWIELEEPLAAAIFVHGFCELVANGLADNEKDNKAEFNNMKEEFTSLAVCIINAFYEDKKSDYILKRQLPNWGNGTCLELAAKVKNKRFISQTPCQEILDSRWGNEESVIFCLIICLLLITFMPFTLLYLIRSREGREDMLGYFSKPKVKYILNAGSYFVFLGVFSYYMLVSFKPTFSSNEGVLCFWVFTLLCEKIRQLSERRNDDGIRNMGFWNVLDVIAIITFTSGMILRTFEDSFEVSRVVMCFVLLTFFTRVLYIFLGSVQLGPQLVMIGKLVTQDLLPFVFIILIFVVAYAISSEALLYPNTKLSWKLIYHLPRKAYWQIYGELFLDDIEGESQCTNDPNLYDDYDQLRCPTEVGKYIAPFLLAIYIFLINVLLLNLLIALFSTTITAIQDDSYPYWGYQRYERVMEYETRPILPPPFIFFEHVYRLIVYIRPRCICIRSRCIICICLRCIYKKKNQVDPQPNSEKISTGEALTYELNQSYSRAEKSKAQKCLDLLKNNPQLAQNNYNHLPIASRHQLTKLSDTAEKEDRDTTNDTGPLGSVDKQPSLSQIVTSIQRLEQKIDSKYRLNRRDELKLILDEMKKIEAAQKLCNRQLKTVTQKIQEQDDDYEDYQNDDIPTHPPYRGQAKNKLLHSSLCFSNLAEYQRLRRLAIFRKLRDQPKWKKKKAKKTKTDAENVANTV